MSYQQFWVMTFEDSYGSHFMLADHKGQILKWDDAKSAIKDIQEFVYDELRDDTKPNWIEATKSTIAILWRPELHDYIEKGNLLYKLHHRNGRFYGLLLSTMGMNMLRKNEWRGIQIE